MRFSLLVAAVTAGLAAANENNTISFQSLDKTNRTIYWTANFGGVAIAPTIVPGGKTVNASVPYGWSGNYFSVSDGAAYAPGMLGEVAFQAWLDMSYFDVSAIVNPADTVGVMEMYPADDPWTPRSGCAIWPCPNAYWAPNDIQTKSMMGNRLVTTLGGSGNVKRHFTDEEVDSWVNYPRDAVTNPKWMPRG